VTAAVDASLVVDRIRGEFGIEAVAVEPIVGGLDPDAVVWRVTGVDGRPWAVKLTRRDNRFGLLLARSLARAGVAGVPDQLECGGLPWSDGEGGRLSISAWIDGREAFETGLSEPEWRLLGRLLRAVHDHEPPTVPAGAAAADGAERRRGIRRAGARIGRRLRRIDRLVADPVPRSAPDPALDRVAAAWPDVRRRVVALRDAAARLKKARTPTTRVSCHGDPHLGNVLVDDDGQPWLIDFDDAVVAPREVDLMLIELGVLFTMPVSDVDRRAFHRGYGALDLDDDRILRFGCVRAIEDLLESVGDLLDGHPARLPADLETLIDGVLSPRGLAGLVEARLARK
jgi:spectinomycin phosphotransferase